MSPEVLHHARRAVVDWYAIRTGDGREAEYFQPTRKGHPEAPLGDADLNQKFLELASPVLGVQPASVLLEPLWRASLPFSSASTRGPH